MNIARAVDLFGKLVCMSAVCVHVTKGGRCSAITEQMHQLVDAFGVSGMETDKKSQQLRFLYSHHSFVVHSLPKLNPVSIISFYHVA